MRCKVCVQSEARGAGLPSKGIRKESRGNGRQIFCLCLFSCIFNDTVYTQKQWRILALNTSMTKTVTSVEQWIKSIPLSREILSRLIVFPLDFCNFCISIQFSWFHLQLRLWSPGKPCWRRWKSRGYATSNYGLICKLRLHNCWSGTGLKPNPTESAIPNAIQMHLRRFKWWAEKSVRRHMPRLPNLSQLHAALDPHPTLISLQGYEDQAFHLSCIRLA